MLYLLLLLAAFVLTLVVRALLFVPRKREAVPAADVTVNETRALENFQAMIRCRTLSYDDPSLQDEKEFEKFRALLDERYPLVAQHCEKHRIGPAGVVYHWKGEGSADPWVLMSHYDVVPVEESMWSVDPFGALMRDGAVWGRGTVDTKSTLLGVMEAAETLLSQGFRPRGDIYLAFGGDEELSGASAQEIVKWFEETGPPSHRDRRGRCDRQRHLPGCFHAGCGGRHGGEGDHQHRLYPGGEGRACVHAAAAYARGRDGAGDCRRRKQAVQTRYGASGCRDV